MFTNFIKHTSKMRFEQKSCIKTTQNIDFKMEYNYYNPVF